MYIDFHAADEAEADHAEDDERNEDDEIVGEELEDESDRRLHIRILRYGKVTWLNSQYLL